MQDAEAMKVIAVLQKMGFDECIDYVLRLYDFAEKIAKKLNISVSKLTKEQLKKIRSEFDQGNKDVDKVSDLVKSNKGQNII